MTQQEITQIRNEQIALMLDWEQYQNSEERWFGHWKPSTTLASMIEKPWSIRVERLEFDSDWNWLMEGYNYITKYHDIAWKITSKGVEIHNHGQGIDIWYETNCPKNVIKDAFLALSDFAKLYNEGKL